MASVAVCLAACAPVHAIPPAAVPAAPAPADGFTGFGWATTGGGAGPVFRVRSLADAGAGSLRAALAAVRGAGGGRVLFDVGGDVILASGLDVPANTTVDALGAPAPGVTLWGDAVEGGRGVVNVLESNVVVRGLRIRNAANDGIHVAPKRGAALRGVVIDHCSITNSADGGIDVTGAEGLTVGDVTLSWNYVAGSGAACAKGTCGGGALVKYGVTRISVHANLWDKNLRRNPTIDGGGVLGGTLADVRGNVVRGYEQSGIQIVAGARANVVGNAFERIGSVHFPDGHVYMAANEQGGVGNVALPFPVEAPLPAVAAAAVLAGAGALPRDELDDFYLHEVGSWTEMKALAAGPEGSGTGPTPMPTPDAGPSPAPTHVWLPLAPETLYPLPERPPQPIDQAALARFGDLYRAARARQRRAAGRPQAVGLYGAAIRVLEGAAGPLADRAHASMARAEIELARIHRRRPLRAPADALQHARAAAAHCGVAPCTRPLTRAAARALNRATRDLARAGRPLPAWRPPAY